jgi:hypothetical protein
VVALKAALPAHASAISLLLQLNSLLAPENAEAISVILPTDHRLKPVPSNRTAWWNMFVMDTTFATSQPPKSTFIELAS